MLRTCMENVRLKLLVSISLYIVMMIGVSGCAPSFCQCVRLEMEVEYAGYDNDMKMKKVRDCYDAYGHLSDDERDRRFHVECKN